jgi:hypothetical protein
VFDQDATVRFSSLPGAGNTDLSPLATLGDFERTGATTDPGGALNDYRAIDDAPVTVATQVPVLTLVATSEPGSPAATVVPGEVLRFRMVVQVPEGTASGAEMVPTLPAGLRFVNDGSVTVAFVANGGGAGIDSTTIAGGALDAAVELRCLWCCQGSAGGGDGTCRRNAVDALHDAAAFGRHALDARLQLCPVAGTETGSQR